MVQGVLRDDTSVAKPPPVGLYSTRLGFRALELLSLNDVAIGVTNSLGGDAILGQQLYRLCLFRISVEVLTLDLLDAIGLGPARG